MGSSVDPPAVNRKLSAKKTNQQKITKDRNTLKDRLFHGEPFRVLGKGLMWPPDDIRRDYKHLLDGVTTRQSTIPGAGLGCFTTRSFADGEVVMLYGGAYSSDITGGAYALLIHTRKGVKYQVDGRERTDPWAVAGAINDFVWDMERNNCVLKDGGLIVAKGAIPAHTELFMSYSTDYNWRSLITHRVRNLAAALDPIRVRFPIPDAEWTDMSDTLQSVSEEAVAAPDSSWLTAAVRVIDGSASDGTTHSSIPEYSAAGSWQWWLEQTVRCGPIAAMISIRHPQGFQFKCRPEMLRTADDEADVEQGVRRSGRVTSRRPNYCEDEGIHARLVRGDMPAPLIPSDYTWSTPAPLQPKRVRREEVATTGAQETVVQADPPSPPAPSPDTSLPAAAASESLLDAPSMPTDPASSQLRLASWNAGGISTGMRFLPPWVLLNRIDIMVIVDAQATKQQARALRTTFQNSPGGVGFRVSCFRPAVAVRGKPIGGQLIITSPRVDHLDIRELISHGCVTQISGSIGGSPFTVCGTYWPLPNDSAGSFMTLVRAARSRELNLPAGETIDVMQDIKFSISAAVEAARRKGTAAYVVGDFNSDMRPGKTDRWHLASFILDNQLVAAGSPDQLREASWSRQIDGHTRSSRIDHILGPSSCPCAVTPVLHFALDHLGLVADLPLYGRASGKAQKLKLPPIITISDEANNERYRDALAELNRQLDAETYRYTEEELLETMSRRTAEILQHLSKKRRSKRSGVSVALMHADYDYGRLIAIGRHVSTRTTAPGASSKTRKWTRHTFRPGLNRLLKDWRNYSQKLEKAGFKRPDESKELAAFYDTCSYDSLVQSIGSDIKTHGKHLRVQVKKEYDAGIKTAIFARESNVAEGRIGGPIRSLLDMSKQKDPYTMSYLLLSGVVILEATLIHATVTGHFNEWFKDPDKDTAAFIPPEDWRKWGADMDTFKAHFGHKNIPEKIVEKLHAAFQPKRPTDDPSLKGWQTDLLRCPTLVEFKEAIAAMPHESAGGLTGLTYDMVKLWPEAMVTKAYNALANLFRDRAVPKFWQLAWLVPIPKCEQPSLLDLRPLSLLEAIRKIWMSITVRRLQDGFKRLRVLDDAQEGSLRGRGTDTAIARFLNMLESVKEHAGQIYFSSWDMSRAFDSITKSLLIYAWVRLGVPEELAVYITSLDIGGTAVVRTPHATSLPPEERKYAGFCPERGTGQGKKLVFFLAWKKT